MIEQFQSKFLEENVAVCLKMNLLSQYVLIEKYHSILFLLINLLIPYSPKIRGTEKVLLFIGWPKIFPKPLYNSKQKRKKNYSLKVAENKRGRKLEGPKIRGAEKGAEN